MQKLILQNFQSPGDLVMLTAAIRDLHLSFPGQFQTDVRSPFPDLFENNPYITPIDTGETGVRNIYCEYPLINRSNTTPHHFIHGFIEFLNDLLQIRIRPTLFKGDIHLAPHEKGWISQVQEITGSSEPFWLVFAGGKLDFTNKWWDHQRYQQVVDHFRGRIQFVQVGDLSHQHHPLQGVIDLRGKTNLRQLTRLVYHSAGVLGPVSLGMHLAAAVETKTGYPPNRACVVIAGGREPSHWEAYPHHQFIHTNGALKCCSNGGCWKARVKPLGDGDERDRPENLCVDVVGKLPRCMDMITAEDVIRRIEIYYNGGNLNYLTKKKSTHYEQA